MHLTLQFLIFKTSGIIFTFLFEIFIYHTNNKITIMTFQAEFQAVVLAAGKGSRMSEITAGKPKCLLPVGPKPLIWYILNNLQIAGFSEVILVVLETQKSEIQNAIENLNLDIKVDYVSLLEEHEDSGTADSLRLLHDRIKSDVLVLSCDLISDVNLKSVIDIFRQHNASVASLLLPPLPPTALAVPGPKSKHRAEKDLIGIDNETGRLVFLASASDFEEELSLPKTLLKKHTHIKLYSNLIDSHVYAIKKWVIQFLKSEESFSSIKGELLPFIVKKQLSKPPKPAKANQSIIYCEDNGDIFAFSKENELDLAIREASSFNDHTGDLKPAYMSDSIRCYAYIAPKDSFGLRVNTLSNYWLANTKIIECWEQVAKGSELTMKSPTADILSNQVDDKCIIWGGAKLSEKTSYKNAIIGVNSQVANFSRVFNSIVMNNVTIKEEVALENCIVCDGAVIENGCILKSCLVGSSHTVPEHSEHAHEVLTESDRLMEF